MISLYVYIAMMLLVFVFLLDGLNISLTYAPKKIKILSSLSIIVMMLRIAALLILFFSRSINYLFILKPFVFLDFLVIPIMSIICFYIFIRNDKINFSYIFAVASMLMISYLLAVYKLPAVVQISQNYGYTISFIKQLQVSFAHIILNTLLLVFIILQIGKVGINTIGLYFMLVSIVVCIAEVLLNTIGMEIIPERLIGSFLVTLVLNYGLRRLRN